jgi:hypothetical protein
MLDKPTSMENLSKAANETVKDTARYKDLISVLDKGWEAVQKKTFTNWINNYLKQCGAGPVVDLASDLSSGENLILLLRI